MKHLSFVMACLYYYVKETAILTALLMATAALMFMIYKLVGWALWVMSL